MKKVLIVIDTDSKLIHVGQPEEFNGDLLIKYAREGCTIATVSLEEYRKFSLYEKVEVIINP